MPTRRQRYYRQEIYFCSQMAVFFTRAMVLKVQSQTTSISTASTYQKCRFSGATPDLPNHEVQGGWDPAICVVRCFLVLLLHTQVSCIITCFCEKSERMGTDTLPGIPTSCPTMPTSPLGPQVFMLISQVDKERCRRIKCGRGEVFFPRSLRVRETQGS